MHPFFFPGGLGGQGPSRRARRRTSWYAARFARKKARAFPKENPDTLKHGNCSRLRKALILYGYNIPDALPQVKLVPGSVIISSNLGRLPPSPHWQSPASLRDDPASASTNKRVQCSSYVCQQADGLPRTFTVTHKLTTCTMQLLRLPTGQRPAPDFHRNAQTNNVCNADPCQLPGRRPSSGFHGDRTNNQ